MDTLSSSVSTLRFSALHSTPTEFYYFKTPNTVHQPHLSSTAKPNSISNKTTFFSRTKHTPLPLSSPSHPTPPFIHRRPATGYAAALLDVAQCNNCLESVDKDVKRLSHLVQNEQIQALFKDPLLDEESKGQVVKEIAKIWKFNKHLVSLLKMMIEKNKVGLVTEVLSEFQRIYDELVGTKVVLVCP